MIRRTILLTLLFSTLWVWAGEIEDFRFAVGLYRDGNYSLAKSQLDSFIADYPNSSVVTDAHFLLANSCLMQQEYIRAKQLYTNLKNNLRISINIIPEVLLGLAQSEFYLDDFPNSKQHFKDFINKYPNHKLNWKTHYYLGRIALRQHDYKLAISYLNKAETSGENIDVKITRMQIYLKQERLEDAEKIVKEFINKKQQNEKTAATLVSYLAVLLENGDNNKVLQIGSGFIKKKSEFYNEYREIIGIAQYENGDIAKAISSMQSLESERAHYYTALCFLKQERKDDAKPIFIELRNSAESGEIRANSLFYLGRLEHDPQTAISLLQEFKSHSLDNKFLAASDFQIGLNRFILGDYSSAKNSLEQAIKYKSTKQAGRKALDRKSCEKIDFLLAEIEFEIGDKELAFRKFTAYKTKYSEGLFLDEVIYKRGFYFFEKEDWADARSNFLSIINNYPNSSKIGMAHYYMGILNLHQSRLSSALEHLEKAKDNRSDSGLTFQKLALVNYKLKNYDKAQINLTQVPNEYRYLLQNYLLSGKIYFARKKYDMALESFDQAAKYEETAKDKENILNLKAWTYYQMNQFENASIIYEQLSGSSGSDFTLKAATSAFSAEDYFKAIELYKRYLQNSPQGRGKVAALLGIADSFYNLGDYANALEKYRILINDETKPNILENAVNGMRWCCEQLPDVEYAEQLERQISSAKTNNLKRNLLQLKMKYEMDEQQWQNGLTTAQRLISLDETTGEADSEKARNVQMGMAYCQKKLKKYDEAETTYEMLGDVRADSELLFQWADLYLVSADYEKARIKLTEATRLTRNPEVWLGLLETDLITKHEDFDKHYGEFSNYASEKDQALADLFWIEHRINAGEYDTAEAKLNLLNNNPEKEIKANSYFLRGYLLYKRGDNDAAIPELLRVRYLYPEFINLKNRAESVACLAYLNSGRKDEATQLHELIRNDIPAEYKQQIESKLGGE